MMNNTDYDRSAAAESLIEHLVTPGRRPLTRQEVELLFELYSRGIELPSDADAIIEVLRREVVRTDTAGDKQD